MNQVGAFSLGDSILLLTAESVRCSREALTLLRGDTPYLSTKLWELKTKGFILQNKKAPWAIRLSEKGANEVAQISEDAYRFYMKYSYGNRPGSTERHIEAQIKISEIHALLSQAGIKIGSQKPSPADILAGKVPRLAMADNGAFFMNREMRFSETQKVSRAQISRSSGILYSKGVTGLVYNTRNEVLGIGKTAERETNFRIEQSGPLLFYDAIKGGIKDSIIIGHSLQAANLILTEQSNLDAKRRHLGDAVKNPRITGTEFRFIPLNTDGITSMKVITSRSRSEILAALFREDEIEKAANDVLQSDAIIGNLHCFETVSCNLSKLYRVTQLSSDVLRDVGLVCMEYQTDFLRNLFQKKGGIKLRVIKNQAIEHALIDKEG